jgi:phage virion morphogenesis protein
VASIRFEFSDRAIQSALKGLEKQVTDLTPAMRDIGESLLLSTRKNFDSEAEPEGRKWAPLSPRYAIAKGKKKNALRGILTLTGTLRDTISYEANSDSVRVGSNRIYAPIHQLGGRAGRGGKSRIPARPFLGLNDGDRANILGILRQYLEKG